MLMHWYALCCCGLCLFLCGSCELCMTPLLNHFLSSINCTYADIQTPWWDQSGLWFIEMHFGLFLEIQCVFWDVPQLLVRTGGILRFVNDVLSCWYRTIVNVIWWFLLAHGDLMFLLWIFFWYFFPVTCIGLRWFYVMIPWA